MKEIDEKGLSEATGGRSLKADERRFLEEKKAYYKDKLDSRKLSPKQYWDIMLQIDYYHRYVGLLKDVLRQHFMNIIWRYSEVF